MTDSLSSAALVGQLFQRDPALLANPIPAYRQLRDADPVLWVDGPPGGPPWLNAWHLFAYDDINSGLRDPRFASRRQMAAMPLEHFGIDPTTPSARFFWTVQSQMMLTMDPPDHTRLRRLVLLAFTPRVVEGMRQEIQETVSDLLDATGDGFDIVADVAAPLPAIVIARMLGISPDDWPQFKRWSDGLIGFNITQEKLNNFLELGDYLRERIAERRSGPQDDLISGLVAARDEADALTEDELVSQLIMLLVGGHETSTYAIGNAVYRLIADRVLWDSLPDNRIDLAVDELLRYDSPFQALSRIVAEPVTIGHKVLDPGATVWLWIAAANHDPSQFADPERIDLRRDPNKHLTFGLGPHYCLGAALARLELQVTLATLRERFPSLRLATDTVELRRDGAIRGPSQLQVDWKHA